METDLFLCEIPGIKFLMAFYVRPDLTFYDAIIIPRHEVEGGYRNGFRPSVRPSFRPSVRPSVRHISFPEQNTKTVRDILTKLGT